MEIDKYKELFTSEAIDHLNNLDIGLVQFEKNPEDKKNLEELLRHTHNLKGLASTMGYGEITNLTHSLEGMLENIKTSTASGSVGSLFGAVDELRRLIEVATAEGKDIKVKKESELVGKLVPEDEDRLFRDLSVIENPEKIKKIGEIRIRTDKLDKIMEVTSELIMNKLQIESWDSLTETRKKLLLDKNSHLVDELQHQILQLRLTPVARVFNRFPRMMRDLSSILDKKIEFVIEGSDIEIDGEILDIVGEPIVHLLRNAADHGIEKEGTIRLKAERVRDTVQISVSDTGRGIDWKKLADKSGKRDLKDPRDLLFQGVSTADKVTEISGRGIGMGVVKDTLEKLGGHITVFSERGKGTTFIIELPVSIAIIKGLVIEDSGSKYIAPVSNIEKIYNLDNLEVMYQAEQAFTIIENTEIPLIALETIIKIKKENAHKPKEKNTVLVVNKEDILYGFIIDQVISQQDVVVQPLPDELRDIIPFSTATILGDGSPAPIIDFSVMIK